MSGSGTQSTSQLDELNGLNLSTTVSSLNKQTFFVVITILQIIQRKNVHGWTSASPKVGQKDWSCAARKQQFSATFTNDLVYNTFTNNNNRLLTNMNKENNRTAAGLRRSALVEKIRLREEWSALKGITEPDTSSRQQTASTPVKKKKQNISTYRKKKAEPMVNKRQVSSEVLRGVVALVEVGAESRALALRAALGALGASVVPAWNPLVTHLIWAQGGCRSTRAEARALASQLVSPLWVEACASSNRRLPEQIFPAAARPSDLPSPRALRRMLTKADLIEIDEFNDGKGKNCSRGRLQLTDDRTTETRQNRREPTPAPRRDVPRTAPQPRRRKLYTPKQTGSDEEQNSTASVSHMKQTQAEPTIQLEHGRNPVAKSYPFTPSIVLTGLQVPERQAVVRAVRSLNGRLHTRPNNKTTHVLLGSCIADPSTDADDVDHDSDTTSTGSCIDLVPRCKKGRTLNALNGAARGCLVLHAQWALDSLKANRWLDHDGYEVEHIKISQIARVERKALRLIHRKYAYNVFNGFRVCVSRSVELMSETTDLLALCGATVLHDDGNNSFSPLKYDVSHPHRVIGHGIGEVSPLWVYDSVADGRMRNLRDYINKATCHRPESS